MLVNALNYDKALDSLAKMVNNASTYKDRKSVWARLPLAFDTETSTVPYTEDRDISFVYVSQFGIGVGADAEQWIVRDFDLACNVFTDLVRNIGVCIRIGIHNTGFDWSFMVDRLYRACEEKDIELDALLDKPNTPVTVTLEYGKIKLQIVDTARIFNMSLESVGKKFTNSKKAVGKLDYDLVRNSVTPLNEEETEYCLYDVIVGAEAMENLYQRFTDKGDKFPLTSTGMVRNILKRNYKEVSKDIDFLNLCPKDGKGKPSFGKYFPLTFDDYKLEFMLYLFRGGLTHGNISYLGEIVKNVTCVDYTSSYPAVMFQKSFPISKWFKESKLDIPKYCDGKTIFYTDLQGNKTDLWNVPKRHFKMHVRFTDIVSRTKHSIESESKAMNFKGLTDEEIEKIAVIDNGRIYGADELEVMLTELDYHNYARCYKWRHVELISIEWAVGGRLPQYLIKTMTEPYITKARLKAQGLPYDAEKALVNSSYGMCVQRLNLKQYRITMIDDMIDTSTAKFEDKVYSAVDKKLPDIIEAFNSYYDDTIDLENYTEDESFGAFLEKYTETKAYQMAKASRILSPYWGLYIAGHARHNLIQCLMDIEEIEHNCVVYYDTDSLYIKDIEKVRDYIDGYNKKMLEINQSLTDDKELWDLGQFEYDPVCHRFKHLGAKRYIKEMTATAKDVKAGLAKEEGQKIIKSTIAGLKKNYFNKFEPDEAFEKFTQGFTVEAIMTGKMAASYFHDVVDIEVTDYMGNVNTEHVAGGCVLSKSPFSLVVADYYLALAEKMKS